jgi:hypothetical protein
VRAYHGTALGLDHLGGVVARLGLLRKPLGLVRQGDIEDCQVGRRALHQPAIDQLEELGQRIAPRTHIDHRLHTAVLHL